MGLSPPDSWDAGQSLLFPSWKEERTMSKCVWKGLLGAMTMGQGPISTRVTAGARSFQQGHHHPWKVKKNLVTEKEKYCMTSLIYGILNDTNEFTYKVETHSQTEKKLTAAWDRIVTEFGMDMYTLLCLKWITNNDLLIAHGTGFNVTW